MPVLSLYNDEPTLDDLLSRTELIQRIGDAIATSTPPQVFGLHGDWGTGKTSALHQIHWDLVGDCPQQSPKKGAEFAGLGKGGRYKDEVTVVWFEAWRYQNEKAPIVALLQEIRTQLPWYAKALKASQKLSEVAIRGALLSLEDLTKRIGIQASKIQEAGERWEEENLATRLPSHMIRQHLEEALKTLLARRGKKPQRLVVLVDDLDRCEAETAYQLLEGIKIYLNLPSCVFVLGMNQDIIEGAVARHLPRQEDDHLQRRMAKRYLEKLCQNVWHIPLVQDPGDLLERYLGEDGVAHDLTAVVRTFDCLPPIPRKIKGYANLLARFEPHLERVRQEHENAGSEPERWAQLAVAYTYLYHFHNRLYRLLWQNGREFWDQLLLWCTGEPHRVDAHLGHLELRQELPEPDSEAGKAAEKPATIEGATEPVTVFHDPAADNVLHVEALIQAIGPIDEKEAAWHLLQ